MSNLHKMKKGFLPNHIKWFLNLCRESKLWKERKGKKDVWSRK